MLFEQKSSGLGFNPGVTHTEVQGSPTLSRIKQAELLKVSDEQLNGKKKRKEEKKERKK